MIELREEPVTLTEKIVDYGRIRAYYAVELTDNGAFIRNSNDSLDGGPEDLIFVHYDAAVDIARGLLLAVGNLKGVHDVPNVVSLDQYRRVS